MMSASIRLGPLRAFLPAFCLCLGSLLLGSPESIAQELIDGGNAGIFSSSQSCPRGGPVTFSVQGNGYFPGTFFADYEYHSFGSQGISGSHGIRYNQWEAGCYLPVRVNNTDSIIPYVVVEANDVRLQPATFGWATAALRFGGSWRTQLSCRLRAEMFGEYNTKKRGPRWYSGGQGGIVFDQQVFGSDFVTLAAVASTESAGDMLIFPKAPAAWTISLGYTSELFAGGPKIRLIAKGYRRDLQPTIERGYEIAATLAVARDMLAIKAIYGHDSIFANYAVLRAGITVAF